MTVAVIRHIPINRITEKNLVPSDRLILRVIKSFIIIVRGQYWEALFGKSQGNLATRFGVNI
ncbi:MAG: hypothetical protein AAGE59_01655 [Cyanobacteria bacterium P01_F01_bin.86]